MKTISKYIGDILVKYFGYVRCRKGGFCNDADETVEYKSLNYFHILFTYEDDYKLRTFNCSKCGKYRGEQNEYYQF